MAEKLTVEQLISEGYAEEKSRQGRRAYVDSSGSLNAIECSKCGEIKHEADFPRKRNGLYGRLSNCRACEAEYRQKYYRNNKERDRENNRNYYKDNREQIIEMVKTWQRVNPERVSISNHRRRATVRMLPSTETMELRYEAFSYFDNECALTGRGDNLHADHVIPLATGHGGTVYGNMIPLVQELNISKSDSHIFEWFDANRERFELPQERFNKLISWLAEANGITPEEYRKYVDWCFGNPRIICEESNSLVFEEGPINERNKNERKTA